MSTEFILRDDGSCQLVRDGVTQWSSDDDADFLAEFDARIESEDIDEVLDWLEEAGQLDPDESLDIVDESAGGDDGDL